MKSRAHRVIFSDNVSRRFLSSLFSYFVEEGEIPAFECGNRASVEVNISATSAGSLGTFLGESQGSDRSPFEIDRSSQGSEIILHLLIQGFAVEKRVDFVCLYSGIYIRKPTREEDLAHGK